MKLRRFIVKPRPMRCLEPETSRVKSVSAALFDVVSTCVSSVVVDGEDVSVEVVDVGCNVVVVVDPTELCQFSIQPGGKISLSMPSRLSVVVSCRAVLPCTVL